MTFKRLSKRTRSRDVGCDEGAGFLVAPNGCQREIVKRTFSYAGVRTHATLAVLLSSIALYATLLYILAAAVT